MKNREKLKNLLIGEKALMVPGAYSALTAKLVEQTGFSAVYLTGFGTAAHLLGKPDYGLVTMNEMVSQVKTMCQAIDIPLIADADTGYGNEINVRRTVEEYELAGAAAIQLEDQVFPKRCGHMNGKLVIPMEEHVRKIKAAVSSRNDTKFLIMSRTDARAVNGLDDAIRRGYASLEAGADILFIEAPQSIKELEIIGQTFHGVPLVANMVENGKTPYLYAKELEQMGYKIIVYPVTLLFTATFAIQEGLKKLRENGKSEAFSSQMVSFEEFNEIVGLSKYREWEKSFQN
jgi:2-methylisocitrate lyase-like PEP mutase family enzyme